MQKVVSERLRNHDWLRLLIRISVLLAVFLLVETFMTVVIRLPAEAYDNGAPTTALFSLMGSGGRIAALIIGLLIFLSGAHSTTWRELEYGALVRAFIVFLCTLITWFVCTLGYNHYFQSGFYAERTAALIFLLLLVWRPVFIFPWLIMTFLLLWQTSEPALNNGSHLAHKLQVLHVLNLFAAWLVYNALIGKRRTNDYFFLVICLVAAAYWAPAFKKLLIGWLYQGELFNMLLNAHAHGWLSFIDSDSLTSFVQKMNVLDVPGRLFVFVIEAGCLFLLWRRTYCLIILVCLTLFHLGVFALFGYFFWTWMSLNAAVIVTLYLDRQARQISIFTPTHLLLSIVLIAGGKYWCNPSQLAWIDARLTYTYRFEAVGNSGTVYTVPFRFFEPYGDVFTMANFPYLTDQHLMLVNPYGASSRPIADALREAKSAQEVFALESSLGVAKYDVKRVSVFKDFLQRVFMNTGRSSALADTLYAVGPPRQFWTQPRGHVFAGQEPISTIHVKEVTTFYDGNSLDEIREIPVLTIDLNHEATREIISTQ